MVILLSERSKKANQNKRFLIFEYDYLIDSLGYKVILRQFEFNYSDKKTRITKYLIFTLVGEYTSNLLQTYSYYP